MIAQITIASYHLRLIFTVFLFNYFSANLASTMYPYRGLKAQYRWYRPMVLQYVNISHQNQQYQPHIANSIG